MNLLSKYSFLVIVLISVPCAQGMQQAREQKTPSFAQAIMKADMGYGTDWLQRYVEAAPDLNEKCSQSGTYQIQDLVSGRYNSDLVTTAVSRGARIDLADNNGNTVLHTIARCPWLGCRKEYAYFPEQNLLSVLALATHQNQEPVVVADGQNEIPEEERVLRSSKGVIKTFLLCLTRPEVSALKPVRFCIIAHLMDKSCPEIFFRITLPQMQDPLKATKEFPFAWFAHIAQHNTGDDQKAFLKKYAPLFAQSRIKRAQEIALRKNKGEKDVYELSCRALQHMKEQKLETGLIEDAQKMVDLLNPEGFLERHTPACTLVIENMLLGRSPFADFHEWQTSKPVIQLDTELSNNR